MFALRSFARSVPRAVTRVSKPIVPRAATFWAPKPQPVLRSFSTSIWRREAAGQYDQVLVEKLAHEHQLELESKEHNDNLKADVDDFFANSEFKVQDKPGTHDVTLTRQFGNETIKLEFSIVDMYDIDEEFDPLEEDNAFGDEDMDVDNTSGGKRTINQSGTKGGKIDVAPEDSLSPSDRGEDYDESLPDSQYHLNLTITVSKKGKGATVIHAVAQNGAIDVENLSYFPREELVEPSSPELGQESDSVYNGPPFANLDTDLQSMIIQYLEERGINAELAEFLPQYVDYKEQREYVRYLDNLKKFVEA